MAYSLALDNDVRFYGERVPSEKILPIHKRRLASSLDKYLLNLQEIHQYLASQAGSGSGSKTASVRFQYAIKKCGAEIEAGSGSKQTLVPKQSASDEILKIQRIARYYQNIGYVSRDFSKDRLLTKTAGRVLAQMQPPQTPRIKDTISTGVRFTENTLSLVRDGLKLCPEVGPDHAFVANYGFAAGSVWSFFAVKEWMDGIDDYEKAKLIGDSEGARRAAARSSNGFVTMCASSLYLSSKILSAANALESAITAISYSSNAFFGIGAMIGMGINGLGIYRCSRFNSRIDEYLNNPDPDLKKSQKLKGALRFLKDSMSVTPEERKELRQKIEREHCDETPEERKNRFDEAVAHLAETKIKYMKRRTSNKSLEMMLDPKSGIDALLPLLENEGDRAIGAVNAAEELIHEVKKQTWKKMFFYALGFIASLVGLIGIISGTFLTGGALPFVLLGISAAIFAFLTGYNLYKSSGRSDSDTQSGINMQPLDASLAGN